MTPHNPYVPTDFPLEMRDLLIQIDTRTKTIEATLGEIKNQNATLDLRLRKVEDEQNVREGLKERYLTTEKSVIEIERRLHTIETTAKTGASVADWVWRVAPVLIGLILWGATFVAEIRVQDKKDGHTIAAAQNPVAHNTQVRSEP